MIYPSPLRPGDTVALISPATTVKEEYVHGAAEQMSRLGLRPLVMPHALGPVHGSYAANLSSRLQDITDALTLPEVKAIFCTRGGYGCVHLLGHIPLDLLREHPKHLIGFSDVSALHALWQKAGIISLHAPMARHLTHFPSVGDEGGGKPAYCTEKLFELLRSPRPAVDYSLPTSPLSLRGKATGRLTGGNLAVLSHLTGTPYDPLAPLPGEELILFIEDIGEAIYATERMLWQLKLSGALARYKGIVAGQFTGNKPDRNFPSTSAMIASRLREWGVTCPVAIDFPAGHVDFNLPLPLGAQVTLEVSGGETLLRV